MDPSVSASLDDLRTTLMSEIIALKATNAALVYKVEVLQFQVDSLLTPPSPTPVHRWARRWRFLMVVGGLFSPGLAVASILYKSTNAFTASQTAWAAWSFQVFSFTCLFGAAIGDVNSFGRWREKALVVLCGALVGAVQFLSGYALADYEDEETGRVGKVRVFESDLTRTLALE